MKTFVNTSSNLSLQNQSFELDRMRKI